jgi:hypothetical protein
VAELCVAVLGNAGSARAIVADGVLSDIPSVTATATAACFVDVIADSICSGVALSHDIDVLSRNNSVDIAGCGYSLLNSNSLPDAQANDKDRKFEQAELQ